MWSFTGAIGRAPTHVQGGGSGSLCRTHDGMQWLLQPPGLMHAEKSARKSGVTLDLRRGDPEATSLRPIHQSAAGDLTFDFKSFVRAGLKRGVAY